MKSKEDHQWYRGTVIKINKTKAKIYCPDFGFVEKVPMSMLHSIIDCDIIRAKYWASHCSLVDWGLGEEEATTEEKDRILYCKTRLEETAKLRSVGHLSDFINIETFESKF